MKQIKSLLLLRINQCYRYLNEIGFGIIMVALFILTGIIFNALEQIMVVSANWALLFALLVLIATQIKRQDTFFLKSIFQSKRLLIRYTFIENILIVFPILIFQSVYQRWSIILCIMIISLIVALVPFHLLKSQTNERKRDIGIIPLSLFEIKFHFEKNFWSTLLIWVLLFFGCLHISFWILGIFFICVYPVDIFKPIESREMINYSPYFIFKKIKRSIGLFLIIAILPTVLTFIFSQSNIYIFIYGIIALILSLTLSISKKYASYYGVNEVVPSTTSTMILVFLMLAPGGILITLSACIYYYFQAENHMKKIYAIS